MASTNKILFHVVLLISIYANAFAFPTMPSDSWYTVTQANKTVYTSQSSLGYDSVSNKLWMFLGHTYAGTYPQLDHTMSFDIATNTWTSVRPIDSSIPGAA